MVTKSGSAVWQGSLEDGGGEVSTEAGAVSGAPYGFDTRFEDAPGTSPEELIGAAHASCFAMALSLELGRRGLTAEGIEARAAVTLAARGEGFAVTRSHLTVRGTVFGATASAFAEAAEAARATCPVSRLLTAEVTMDAALAA